MAASTFRSSVPYSPDIRPASSGSSGGLALSSALMKQMGQEGLYRQREHQQNKWLTQDRQWQADLRTQQQEAAAGMGDSLSRLVSGYNTAYGEARSANEARYQEMLGIADQTTGQRAADITGDYQQQSANAMQQLARLGMGNTTVAPTMQMGFEREKQASLNRLADTMQGTRLGIMERKEDAYPDLASIQAIIAGAGNTLPGSMGLAPTLEAFANLRQA